MPSSYHRSPGHDPVRPHRLRRYRAATGEIDLLLEPGPGANWTAGVTPCRCSRGAALGGLLVSGLLLSACATVKPWQAGSPTPHKFEDASLAGYRAHWLEAREGSAGGSGFGCGCGCK